MLGYMPLGCCNGFGLQTGNRLRIGVWAANWRLGCKLAFGSEMAFGLPIGSKLVFGCKLAFGLQTGSRQLIGVLAAILHRIGVWTSNRQRTGV